MRSCVDEIIDSQGGAMSPASRGKTKKREKEKTKKRKGGAVLCCACSLFSGGSLDRCPFPSEVMDAGEWRMMNR